MKSAQRKLFFIILPIIVIALLLVAFVCFFYEEEKEPVLNGGYRAPYIEYNGNQYLFEWPTENGNLFFKIQDNWAALDKNTVKYMYFGNEKHLEEDIVYYDTAKPHMPDLYLKVNEQWLKQKCDISGHAVGFVRLHIRPADEDNTVLIGGVQTPRIEYNGIQYLLGSPMADGNLFFEVQENWEELNTDTVKYMYFGNEIYLEEDIVYYDTVKRCLYLRVNEQWLKRDCNISGHTTGYVGLHIYSGGVFDAA